MQTPRGEKTKHISDGIGEKGAYIHTFLSKQHLSRRESVDLRVTLASRASFVSPFPPSPPFLSCNGTRSDSNNHESIRRQNAISTWKRAALVRATPWRPQISRYLRSYILYQLAHTGVHRGCCKGGCKERARPPRREVVALETRGWRKRGKEKGGEREGKEREREGRGPPGFLYVRWRGDGTGGKTGEIARSSGESCKLENFPRPYYLRRDHRPAPRGLSGIPRSLNTPPSSRTTLVCFGGCFERAKRGRMDARKNRDLKRMVSENRTGRWGVKCISFILNFKIVYLWHRLS